MGAAKIKAIGDSGYIFLFNGILVGIIEVKTFWKVTTESIDEARAKRSGSLESLWFGHRIGFRKGISGCRKI